MIALLGVQITLETVIIGALTGLTYAVLAAGLVLVYRATRVINFAHGEIGALSAAVLARLVLELELNFFLSLLLVVLGGGLVAGAIELTVVRRLFRAPRLVLLVATIGVSQLVFVCSVLLPDVSRQGRYPSPLDVSVEVGSVLLRSEHFMVMLFVPAVIAALSLFLSRSVYGIAIRASAENPEAAELAGVSTKRISTLVWVLAGMLAALTVVLINPLRGTIVGLPSLALGPGLLLRALAAALVGGMVSLPLTLLGGVLLGVAEAVAFANTGSPGAADALLIVVVIALVLVRKVSAQDESGTWSIAPRVPPVPATLQAVAWVRRLPAITALIVLALAVLLPFVVTAPSTTFQLSTVLVFGIIGLSVTVLTGWAGQLSLGQFAFVGLGAFTTAALTARGVSFPVAVGYATVAGVLASVVVGFPALRVKGLFLAVTTLAFAVASRSWLFTRDVFLADSSGVFLPRAELLGIDLTSQRAYYFLCLSVLVASALAVTALRNSGVGRSIIAVRDNEMAASSFGLHPALTKLTAFAVAGGLAALAGGLLAGLRVQFGPAAFGPELSLAVVAMTIIGGLGSVAGALLGALYVVGLPAVFGSSLEVTLLTTGVGLLILLLYLPGGLVQVAYAGRTLLLGVAARRLAAAPPAAAVPAPAAPAVADAPVPLTTPALLPPAQRAEPGAVLSVALRTDAVSLGFGGRQALDDVSVEVRTGEVVGLIGSNGAGKSTLMNVVTGFLSPQSGTVEAFGRDVTRLPPHTRAQLGIGRVFQDARLFGGLTVREAIQMALEARERAEVVPSMLALPPARAQERYKRAEAEEHIAFLGLGRYADAFIGDLSTGTRRIVELACLLAQRPRLLLLDEPTAGVAQKETEAFGPLILSIQRELAATVVVIEHDMPLVMSMSDRLYCLSAGRVIAEGTPDQVRSDPAVIAAYLGTDERAIRRSGTVAATHEAPSALADLSRTQLLELAAAAGIQGVRSLRKAELVEALIHDAAIVGVGTGGAR